MKKVYFWFLFFSLSFCARGQYSYPVTFFQDKENRSFILYLHQKSRDLIELFSYTVATGTRQKLLSSSLFFPVGIQLLPSKKGFSFIDNGRVRIKYFNKRSPKTVDIQESLYNIELIYWIDDFHFYMSAKKGFNYGIFEVDVEGNVQTIVHEKGIDCLYPQKVGDQLFYIERSRRLGEFKVVKTLYHDYPTKLFEDKAERLFFCDINPILFLQMVTMSEGYFLQYSNQLDPEDRTISFSCFYIKKSDKGCWGQQLLFAFSLPSRFIISTYPESLCESLLPFVPRYYNGFIYFSDDTPNGLDIFRISLKTKDVERVTYCEKKQAFFAPIELDNRLFWGELLN